MTEERRKQIFAKEVLTIEDVMELFDFPTRQQAARYIREVKAQTGDRFGVQGKLHVLDYFKHIGYTPLNRYGEVFTPIIEQAPVKEQKPVVDEISKPIPLIKSNAYGY